MRRKLLWFALFAALFAWFGKDGKAQNPPAGAIRNGTTQTQNGTNGNCLYNNNGTLGDKACSSGSSPAGPENCLNSYASSNAFGCNDVFNPPLGNDLALDSNVVLLGAGSIPYPNFNDCTSCAGNVAVAGEVEWTFYACTTCESNLELAAYAVDEFYSCTSCRGNIVEVSLEGEYDFYACTSCDYNILLSAYSSSVAYSCLTCEANMILGSNTEYVLYDCVSCSYNTVVSAAAYYSLYSCTTCEDNYAIGYESLENLVSGADNVALGDNTCEGLNGSESNNICLGYEANVASGASGAFAIGYGATASASNHGVIGGSTLTDVYLGSETPGAYLHMAAPTSCTGHPTGTVAAIAGVLNLCP